jgi:hypothetical protein
MIGCMNKNLKLRAKDSEDLQVISAVLQDSIAPVVDMHYLADDKNFVMVVQRLMCDGDTKERVCCAFNLRGVDRVQTHGFDTNATDRMLEFLALMPEGDGLEIIFADDARVRLALKNWSLIVEDFGESWPARCQPCHDGEPEELQNAG